MERELPSSVTSPGDGSRKGNRPLGKNGTGKSTLLYLLSGLLRPQAGHLYFRGADVQKRLPQSLADMYLVPEEFTLPNLSLNQFVRLNASFYPRFSREILRNCLEDFGLNEDIHLGELSMGQKKKPICVLHWQPTLRCC